MDDDTLFGDNGEVLVASDVVEGMVRGTECIPELKSMLWVTVVAGNT